MASSSIADALQRTRSVLQRRPETGLHDDAPATVRWDGGARMVASHANGTEVSTDMPTQFGGTGDQVTPGWLFRAGLASCAGTSIAMAAAAQHIELTALEVRASSRSDARGMLGMSDAAGRPVFAGPGDVLLLVKIAAQAVSPERLHALVNEGYRCSPIPNAVENAVPVTLRIAVQA